MRRVLIVDDNAAFAENVAEIVIDSGVADAVAVDSGARALELLASQRFDVMITDMRMPQMNGAELVRQARRCDPHLPIVVLSAFICDGDLAAAEHHGLLSVLAKPAPLKHLLDIIARARRGGLVVMIEDDQLVAEAIVEALRERGFATMVAHSLMETEWLCGKPCVALIDLRVPGGKDGTALSFVKARFPDSPVIVVTAYPKRVTVPPSIPVIEKPFDVAHLLTTVEKMYAQQSSN